MGYFSKEVYERKAAYAERKMEENSLIESLTREQHEALAELCRIRHEIHSSPKVFFSYESRVWDYIDDGVGGGVINNKLASVGLETIPFDKDPVDYPTDYDWDNFELWDGKYDALDDALTEIYALVAEINTKIEGYLKKIDETYETKYCPTGLSRVF